MRKRGIDRARMFMGALLLLAAAMTWGIGITMSPHGNAVTNGADYLRETVLTYRRKGAIGTLILCALGAWLLFPRRRPKWPARDWSLIGVLALLAGSSLYTLIWLLPLANKSSVAENVATADDGSEGVLANADENLAVTNQPMNSGIAFDQGAANLNASSASQFKPFKTSSGGNAAVAERNDRPIRGGQTAEPPVIEEQSDAQRTAGLQDAGDLPLDNEADGN